MAETERLFVPDTLHALRVGGDMIFHGAQLAWSRVNTVPFIPSRTEFDDLFKAKTDYDGLSASHKRAFNEQFDSLYGFMEQRAQLQRAFSDPRASRRLIEGLIAFSDADYRTEQQLLRSNIQLKWGLFSPEFVFDKAAFRLIRSALGKEGDALGFINYLLEDQVGPVGIVKAGEHASTTLRHEDFHVLQAKQGHLDSPSFIEELTNPAMSRLLQNRDITVEDLTFALMLLQKTFEEMKKTVAVEFPAYLWSRGLAPLNPIGGSFPPMQAAINGINNAAFYP